jgi:hypothetical protein
MSLPGSSATPHKIHDDDAKSKCRNEGDKLWSQTPSKLAVGRHPSCAEDRVTVSAQALTLARSLQPQGPPMKHQESNIHIRAAR